MFRHTSTPLRIVVRLLSSAETSGDGVVVSRINGIRLIGISVTCWPARASTQAFYGMLTYNTLAPLYMRAIGMAGYVGILLWPDVLVHAFLIVLLEGTWLKQRKIPAT
jgi:hypothetical protein